MSKILDLSLLTFHFPLPALPGGRGGGGAIKRAKRANGGPGEGGEHVFCLENH